MELLRRHSCVDSATALFVRVYAADQLDEVRGATSVYCELYVGSDNMSSGRARPSLLRRLSPLRSTEQQSTGCRIQFHTSRTSEPFLSEPLWNEKFHVPVVSCFQDLLTVRVKAKRSLLYGHSTTVLATCVVPLHFIRLNHVCDQWFPLFHPKTKSQSGRIRLQLLLSHPEHAVNTQEQEEQDDQQPSKRLSLPYAGLSNIHTVFPHRHHASQDSTIASDDEEEDLSLPILAILDASCVEYHDPVLCYQDEEDEEADQWMEASSTSVTL